MCVGNFIANRAESLTGELPRILIPKAVSKIRIGVDLGCSEWPKQREDVPSHPFEPLNIGDQDPSSYFPDSFSTHLVNEGK
jgi:hypothetical protein